MAVAWANRLMVTVKRSRNPTLPRMHGYRGPPAVDEPDVEIPGDWVEIGAFRGMQVSGDGHEASLGDSAAQADLFDVDRVAEVDPCCECEGRVSENVLASGVDESVERQVRVADRDEDDGSLNRASAPKVRFLVEGLARRGAVDHPRPTRTRSSSDGARTMDALSWRERTISMISIIVARLRAPRRSRGRARRTDRGAGGGSVGALPWAQSTATVEAVRRAPSSLLWPVDPITGGDRCGSLGLSCSLSSPRNTSAPASLWTR